jgi:hypothetical protein
MKSGFILIEIMIALSLATIFIGLIFMINHNSEVNYQMAIVHKELMKVFEERYSMYTDIHIGQEIHQLIQNTRLGKSISFNVKAKRFGNEDKEIDFEISASTTRGYTKSLHFAQILHGIEGEQCSVDIINGYKVGSYDYWTKKYNNPFISSDISVGNSLSHIDKLKMGIIRYNKRDIHLPVHELFNPTEIDIKGNLLYISEDSNVSSDPDLYIFDISSSTNIILRSSINSGPGLSDFVVKGDYIFASARSTVGQLHIFSLSNREKDLQLIGKYKLPLPFSSSTPTLGSSIEVNSDYIYLGTEKWDGNEFNIIDISNVYSPSYVNGFEIGSRVNDIKMALISEAKLSNEINPSHDNILVANSGLFQLINLNISNPNNISISKKYEFSGSSRQDGKVIFPFENSLIFGRTNGGFNIVYDHELFYWPEEFVSLKQSGAGNISLDEPGGIYGIISDRFHIFLASRTLNNEFKIIDSNIASSTYSIPLDILPEKMICNRDRLYILGHQSPFLNEIYFIQND